MVNWLLVCGLVLLTSCSQVETVYIQILPLPNKPIKADFDLLDVSVRKWNELQLESECRETAEYEMNSFRLKNNRMILIQTILNAETNTVVLAFSQAGSHFTPDAEKLFAEVKIRLAAKFSNDRINVAIDQKTGKYTLMEAIHGRHDRLPMCKG